jgi:hypothetical protein
MNPTPKTVQKNRYGKIDELYKEPKKINEGR